MTNGERETAEIKNERLWRRREGGPGSEAPRCRAADGRVEVGLGGRSDREGVIDRRGLFAFVELTSFISAEQPPSAERLYDRNQSEGNRPYSSTDAPTHRYGH